MNTNTNKNKNKYNIFFIFFLFSIPLLLRFISNTSETPIAIVSSNSMVPALNFGDIIYYKHVPAETLKNGTVENKEGDIIVFKPKGYWKFNLPKDTDKVVHRIVGKMYNQTDNRYYFLTKGDNNDQIDPQFGTNIWIPESCILGKVIFIIPKIGGLILYFSMPNIFIPILFILGIIYMTEYIRKNEKNLQNYNKSPSLNV